MKKTTRWVGLDVHAETIAVAVAEKDGTRDPSTRQLPTDHEVTNPRISE